MHQWAVIGAGPAGIAAIGKLLDYGVERKDIVWLDPHYLVGDFGTIWRNVPSNTKVKGFNHFLHASSAFDYHLSPNSFKLKTLDPEQNCDLKFMAEPLSWVTNQLRKKVNSIVDTVLNLSLEENYWALSLRSNSSITARKVIIATGAEPKNLSYSMPTIPLQDALDSERIKNHLSTEKTIAVFGSSHSAILVLRNLIESGAGRVFNFYRSPLRYAVLMEDWILFDDIGLKGSTAEWARKYIDGKLPENLKRYYSSEENIQQYLPECTDIIYAVGFERRTLPVIDNLGPINYIEQCGILAPGLFGVGIAFPQEKSNRLGIIEHRVGLRKFMEYLNEVLPIWLNYHA